MVTDPARTAKYSRRSPLIRRGSARVSRTRLFLTVLAVLMLGVFACSPEPATSPAAEGEVVFSDPSLEVVIREAIGKDEGPILSSELETLVSLSAPGRGIIDLTGLEYCTNLTSLNLSGNQISSIAPLALLTRLTDLRLGDNQISDIWPLASLIRLRWLLLSNNQIGNISWLSSLTRLNELWLDGNQIGNVSALAALSKLDVLRLQGNGIKDVSPLASLTDLTELWLHENQISDISGLASLAELTYLRLNDNQVGNISALAPLANLVWLHLDNNRIRNVAPLASLSKLTYLYLSNNQISGVASLDSLDGLIVLWLDGNQIGNVSPLASLTALTDLIVDRNQIGDISPLSAIPGLRSLLVVTLPDQNLEAAIRGIIGKPEGPLYATDLETLTSLTVSGRGITDLTGVEYFTRLRRFVASTNQIGDVSPLAGLTGLTYLDLDNNQIGDLSPLSSLAGLTHLYLNDNQIADVSPLASLVELTGLSLRGNQISDASPLATLTKLTELWLQDNPMDDTSALAVLTKLIPPDLDGAERVAVFPDENLEAAIREAIDKPEGPIYAADLEALTSLSAPGRGITNLTGLDSCVNLERLELHDNQISNLSSLADLTSLTELRLDDNQIRSVSSLASLTSLPRLFIGGNQISDVSPLAHLRGLTELWLNDNQIADISPLADLTNLRWLYLNGNQITDVTPVTYLAKLSELWVHDNPIADTSPLASLTGVTVFGEIAFPDPNLEAAVREAIDRPEGRILTSDLVAVTSLSLPAEGIADLTGLEYYPNLKRLDVGGNQISDLSPLAHLRSLTELWLNGNQIADISPLEDLTGLTTLWLDDNQISDISPLESLTNLTDLRLQDNRIADISPLEDLIGLTALWLQDNRIADVSPLASLTGLTEIWLHNNPIADFSPLFPDPNLEVAIRDVIDVPRGPILRSDLETLTALSVARKEITDLSGLEYLVRLERLEAHGNQISDISPLASLTALTELWLHDNQISDISPLAHLTNLTELRLQSNQISNISRLSSLTRLNELWLNDNQISDVSPLIRLRNLSVLWLHNNRIADISPLADLTNLKWLYLNGNEIVDIRPLARNEKVTELHLHENQIRSVSPLASLTDLTRLSLHSNRLSDISPLGSLTDLTWLSLYDNPISDVSPLASLTNLDMLVLGSDQTDEDLPLPPLPGATVLWAVVFPDLDLEAAIRETIRKAEGPIYSLEMEGLISLSLPPGDIADLSGLEYSVNLRRLEITGNAISDLSPLASLTSLTELSLSDNRIVDLSPLASLTNLTELSLSDNRIVDLSPLKSLTGLTHLHLDGNTMSTDSYSFTITMIDDVLPYTSGHGPAKGATGVAVDSSIVVHVLDDGSGVDVDTISMTVNGVSVTPTITGSPADYTLTYDPTADFAYLQMVDVTVDASDLDGNTMSTDSYSFTTQELPPSLPPYTLGHDPVKGATGVAVDSSIVVHVLDDGSGVDVDTISMTVEGASVTPTITGSPADYTLTYDPTADFALRQVVDVIIEASDLDGNTMSTDSYSFTITMIDGVAPYTSGHGPARGATGVSVDSSIVVHVLDDGSGVDVDTISLTVEGASVTPIITGSPADYTLTYDPTADFALLQVVNVTVDASDLDGNTMSTDFYFFTTFYSFTITVIDGVSPYTSGHDPAKGAKRVIGVPADSNIVVHVLDDGPGVDIATISMTVERVSVTPTITGSPADYTLTYDPPADFALLQVVDVAVDAADFDGNAMPTDFYSFTITVIDGVPPYTSGHGPAEEATGVPADSSIIVHVLDDASGVDFATISMTVEGASVTPIITGSPADFTLTYDRLADFAHLQVVDVTVDASDLDGNTMSTDSYSFTIAESDAVSPHTSGHAPARVATGVPADSNIVVHVLDDGSGVDMATISMTVEGVSVTPTITGSPADYTLTYDPTADFALLQVVDVTIEASDLDGNTMSTDSYSFTTTRTDGVAPYTSGHGPARGATGVSADSSIVVHVLDDASGVDIATISMTVEGVSVTPTITGSPADYTLTYDPPADFALHQVIDVTVDASDLDGNQINDLSPLVSLTGLTELWLHGNQINDLSPLASLTGLTELWLHDNQIDDLSPLASLTGLTELRLHGNEIDDLSPLSLLTNLTELALESDWMSDPSLGHLPADVKVLWVAAIPDPNLEAGLREALRQPEGPIYISDLQALTSLSLSGRGITDLTGLEHCLNLERLEIDGNQISDVSPLASLTDLRELWLQGNPIGEISPLASLVDLAELVLEPDQIDDMSPLASLAALNIRWAVVFADPNLESAVREALGRPEGPIYAWDFEGLVSLTAARRDITSLAGLEYGLNLEMVDIDGNQVSDLSPLAALTSLTRLRSSDNQISDISPLASLTNLTGLDLGSNRISDISPLSGLANLTSLDLSSNQMSDISPLSGLTNLTSLDLSSNQVSDVSPLSGLTNLTRLWLGGNQISDISPLVANHGIGAGDTLDIRFNPLSAESLHTHAPELEARGATVLVLPVVVIFPDPNLETAVREAIGKPTGDILSTDLQTLTSLDISSRGISDLTGLEQCGNLASLDLSGNQISDISPLLSLAELTTLSLAGNPLSNESKGIRSQLIERGVTIELF